MRLHLINPPETPGFLSDRDKAGGLGVMFRINSRYRYRALTPPMDWLYAGAVAEQRGWEVTLIDAPAEGLDPAAVLARLKADPPDRLGIRISLPSLSEDLELVKAIKAALPTLEVFGFGNVIRTTHAQWLEGSALDAAFFGEGEVVLGDYLDGKDSASIWRPGRAAPQDWQLLQTLDDLPFPAWHLLDLSRYGPEMTFYVLTTRGCPKACSMCPYYVNQGGPWRQRSVENVLGELQMLKQLGAKRLQARDPNIGLVKKRLRSLAEGMATQGLTFEWVIETDLESLDPETLKVLAQSGLRRLMTGIESADPQILREIHQHPDALKLTIANMKRCEELGIELTGFMVVGSSSESYDSVHATVRMAQALPMNYSVSLMTPYHGTVYREEAEQQGLVLKTGSWRQYSGTECLVRTKHLSDAEVRLAYRWAQGELEKTLRARAIARKRGVAKLWAWARFAKHAAWHAPTHVQFCMARQAHANAVASAQGGGPHAGASS